MQSQVLYTHGGGRLGNQGLRFVHWIAWARAHPGEVEVLNLAFWPYANLFARWREHPGCVFPVRPGSPDTLARQRAAWPKRLRDWSESRTRLGRVVQAAGHWWPRWQAIDLDIVREESIDLESPAFLTRVVRRPVTTCCGWKISCWRLVAAQQAELKEYFRPAPEFEQRAAEFIAEVRRGCDVVVGMLIRQSDYREWNDGRFCFSSEQYAAWIDQLVVLHGGRRVAVVIASEVRQDPAVFAGRPCYFATGTLNAGGHWFESWVELSLCDFIVSPPSTFSATAAFFGGIPLWPVGSVGQTMAFDQMIDGGLAGAARHPIFSHAVK
jgi:hypothetical protein